MQPSVGWIVHYVSYGTPHGEYKSQCRAAIITEVKGHAISPVTMEQVEEWVLSLCVLNPEGMFFNASVVQMEHAHDGGTWHWPERVNDPETV